MDGFFLHGSKSVSNRSPSSALYIYHLRIKPSSMVVSMCTISLNVHESHCLPPAHLLVSYDSHNKRQYFPYTSYDSCEVQTGSLSNVMAALVLQRPFPALCYYIDCA
jgi:hypothetical protein